MIEPLFLNYVISLISVDVKAPNNVYFYISEISLKTIKIMSDGKKNTRDSIFKKSNDNPYTT